MPSYQQSESTWQLIESADGYRLPFEAEWEHACRAGTQTRFTCGDDETLLARYAVIRANQTEPCASRLPNGWGLFDVHGNVYEWCQDLQEPDPSEPIVGTQRLLRGGAFDYEPRLSASSIRAKNRPSYRSQTVGFRLARSNQ